jgi:hypothetical protein
VTIPTEVLVAVIGLLGTALATLIGATAGWYLARRTEKQRWQREDQHRWDNDRRALLASFQATCFAVRNIAFVVCRISSSPDVLKYLVDQTWQCSKLFAEISLLVASVDTVEAAGKLLDVVDAVYHAALDEKSDDEAWASIDRKMTSGLRRYETAVRAEFGLQPLVSSGRLMTTALTGWLLDKLADGVPIEAILADLDRRYEHDRMQTLLPVERRTPSTPPLEAPTFRLSLGSP